MLATAKRNKANILRSKSSSCGSKRATCDEIPTESKLSTFSKRCARNGWLRKFHG